MARRKRRFTKTTAVTAVVFLLALAGYVVSEALLRQNSLKFSRPAEPGSGDVGRLVDWLPKEAKAAVEYRAKYLFLQNRMNHARGIDARVEAIYAFADFIKAKDPKGSDTMLAEIVNNPEYSASRRAYKAYAALLLNPKSSRPVKIEEYQAMIAKLEWPEDVYEAWNAGMRRLWALHAPPYAYKSLFTPLIDEPIPYTNYNAIYAEAVKKANQVFEKEFAEKAQAIRDANIAGKRALAPALMRAPLEYREQYRSAKESVAAAKTPEEKVAALTQLSVLTRDKDYPESDALIDQLLDTPELREAKNFYVPLANLILYNRSKRKLTVKQYQEAISKIEDPLTLYQAWEAGYAQLLTLKAKPQVMLDYLSPLLEREIRHVDYAALFREIEKSAVALKDEAKAEKARAYLQRVQDTYMPSLLRGGREYDL